MGITHKAVGNWGYRLDVRRTRYFVSQGIVCPLAMPGQLGIRINHKGLGVTALNISMMEHPL